MEIKRGDIVLANLSGAKYSEQGKERPVLIVQNDVGNHFSPTTIIIPITSELKKTNMPTHEIIRTEDATGLKVDSMVLCEQIRTIDKRRIISKIGEVSNLCVMQNIFRAYQANFGEI